MTKKAIKVTLRTKKAKKKMSKRDKPTAIGQLIRQVGSLGGGYLGGMVGQPTLGGMAGHQLGALASKWLGFGDYAVTKNSILTKSADGIPYMHKEDQGVILRHKEFVGTVTSTTDFTVQYALPLNPGMTVFPWLSQIASRFQEYRFRGVVFHYIPASGSAIASTNSALGTVMLQTSYRSSDTSPSSKVEMLNEYCSNEVVPSESAIHPIECDPKQNPFTVQYVRSTNVPTGESVLNYDLGRTFIATQGQQSVGNYLGDVWVTYEVELMKPVFSSPVTINPVGETDFNPATTSSFFANKTFSDDTLGLTFSGNTISFPANSGLRFVVVLYFSDATATAITWNPSSVTNGSMNWTQVTQIAGGPAQPMVSICFTKADPSKSSVLTVPTMASLTGSINNLIVRTARAA